MRLGYEVRRGRGCRWRRWRLVAAAAQAQSRRSRSAPTARPRRSSATRTRSASGCSSRSRASTRTATASTDRVAIDIIRPKESGPTLKVPAIIDPQPVLHVQRARQRDAVHPHDRQRDAGQVPAVLRQLLRPARLRVDPRARGRHRVLDRLPAARRPGRRRRLQGRHRLARTAACPGYTTVDGTRPITADWHNGKYAMIGKSYDGTFANGVAATGVEGLTTIVPISAISALVRLLAHGRRPPQHATTRSSLANSITGVNVDASRARSASDPPATTRTACAHRLQTTLDTLDGDEHGDINAFWQRPRLRQGRAKVKASVFASHGIQDDNVRMDQSACGGTAWRPTTSRASCGCCARATSIRSSTAAPCGSTRCTAGSTTGSRASTTASGPSRASTSRTQADIWKNYATGRSRARRTPTSTSRRRQPHRRGHARRRRRGGATDTLTFQNTAPTSARPR